MANDLTPSGKPPRALAIINEPLVPIMPAFRLTSGLPSGRSVYSHSVGMVPFAIEQRREMLPKIAQIMEAKSDLLPAAYSWARNGRLARPLAARMIQALFRALNEKPTEEVIEGMLCMLEGEATGIGDTTGLWKSVQITPAALALACQKLIATVKFPPRPSELLDACREASRKIMLAYARAVSFIESFEAMDRILLEFAYEEWEKPYLLPQYRPLLDRILVTHHAHAEEDSAFEKLVERAQENLALLEEPPEPTKIAAARKPSLTKKSRIGGIDHA
jgi:hypothetical protein